MTIGDAQSSSGLCCRHPGTHFTASFYVDTDGVAPRAFKFCADCYGAWLSMTFPTYDPPVGAPTVTPVGNLNDELARVDGECDPE